MASTLLLDNTGWDLVLDVDGNIAVATEPYALAQDAASAIKLFQGELWYNTVNGVPYWATVLGKGVPLSIVKALLVAAAKTVPGVVGAVCYLSSVKNRKLSGQVQIFDSSKTLIATTGF